MCAHAVRSRLTSRGSERAAPVGFLSTAERWAGGQQHALRPDAVVAYLAGDAQCGVPMHAQAALMAAPI